MVEQVATRPLRQRSGVANADNILFARRAGSVCAWWTALIARLQNSPRCVMVHEASGIDSFDQAAHERHAGDDPGGRIRRLSAMETAAPWRASRAIHRQRASRCFCSIPNTARATGVHLQRAGYLAHEQHGEADPGVLLVSDLGFNPYTSLLFTTETLAAKEPDLVRRMVTASVRGWQDYLADPGADEPQDPRTESGGRSRMQLCVWPPARSLR